MFLCLLLKAGEVLSYWLVAGSSILQSPASVYALALKLLIAHIFILKHVDSGAGGIPRKEPILKQIYVTMQAMPLYTLLPTLSEYMVERGWTRSYARVGEVGLLKYLLFFALYMVIVEFGIYWMHRGLHDVRPLYKSLHATHHIYNKQDTLSPFAGICFMCLVGQTLGKFALPSNIFSYFPKPDDRYCLLQVWHFIP